MNCPGHALKSVAKLKFEIVCSDSAIRYNSLPGCLDVQNHFLYTE